MPYNTAMASWIAHLRIAEILLERIAELTAEPFALGSLAPDSGRPDAAWRVFTPPPSVTHFRSNGLGFVGCADLDFFRRYLLPLRGGADPIQLAFRLGYFCHLMTDTLWYERIDRPTKARWAAEFAADKDFIWEVKKDWYGLDYRHVRAHADCIYWKVLLPARPEQGGLDFLVPESLEWSVAHIQAYYQEQGPRVEALLSRPYIYLSQDQVDAFIDEACACFERIYAYLWKEGRSPDGKLSSLSLLDPEGA